MGACLGTLVTTLFSKKTGSTCTEGQVSLARATKHWNVESKLNREGKCLKTREIWHFLPRACREKTLKRV